MQDGSSRNGKESSLEHVELFSEDRKITAFPEPYTKLARIDEKSNFDLSVQKACRDEKVQNLKLMCKMIVIGDPSANKTKLIHGFCKTAFDQAFVPTIGVDLTVEKFQILGNTFTLQMWDTAGQERFLSIATAYYRGAHIVAIVLDAGDRSALANAEKWLEAVKKERKETNDLLVFLLANNIHLLSSAICKSFEDEVVKMANTLNVEFWAVSSETGLNLKEFFFRAAALAFEKAVLRELRRQQTIFHQTQSGSKLQIPSLSQHQERKCCVM